MITFYQKQIRIWPNCKGSADWACEKTIFPVW